MSTDSRTVELIRALEVQHPNPWENGKSYDAINPFTGEKVRIRKSYAVKTRIPFLHIYVPNTTVVKTPTGEVIDRYPSKAHFRANLRTCEIIRID